ncbi:ABC transporter permease [Paenarthrobacter sp. NPDC058040]|uniref:ABC transporter permease n=1 Tax=unclassified Paenarthrobacter TaxID=2634190 RepID=UPI0036D9C009
MIETLKGLDEQPSRSPKIEDTAPLQPKSGVRMQFLRSLSFRNISAIYILLAIFLIFGLWVPDSFLSPGVWRTLLDAQAVTALAALAALIPLVAGSFNLAVGAEVGLGGILVAALISKLGLDPAQAIALTLLVGAATGLISGLIITRAKIDSFIATLGMSSVLLAGIAWISGSQQILNLGPGFRSLAVTQILGVTLPVYIVFIVALITWYVLEQTPVGRRMYATGFNPAGARLAGVNTNRLIVGSLMAGGVLAALAGVILSSRINAGDPTVGPSVLLPALTAVFLGSTQFKGGRFNVWGTVLAVYVLATGIKGLQLVGAPVWITELFNGLALLLAVGLSKYEKTARRAGAVSRVISRLKMRKDD